MEEKIYTVNIDNWEELGMDDLEYGFRKVSFEQFKKDYLKVLPNTNEDELREIYNDIELPKRSTSGAAGYDISSTFGFKLAPGNEVVIPTGLRVKLLESTFLAIAPRSGSGFKSGMRLANTIGVIDEDYFYSSNEGHIMIKFIGGVKEIEFNRGDKIAQGIVMPYLTFGETVDTKRDGGFGSTGK